MPNIKFIITTEATITRLELDEYDHYVPVDVNDGRGSATLATGYQGSALLYLQGNIGQTAKFKIVQVIGGVDVVLNGRNHIRITSATGRATANVPFIVQ